MARFKLATYRHIAERDRTTLHTVRGVTHYVDRVTFNDEADIVYRKFTKTFSDINTRPFMLAKSKRQFKTLQAAVEALVKEQA